MMGLRRGSDGVMKLQEIKTWEELEDWLLERMDYANDTLSKTMKPFTKEQHWNFTMKQCFDAKGQVISIRIRDIILKRIGKDFKDEEKSS